MSSACAYSPAAVRPVPREVIVSPSAEPYLIITPLPPPTPWDRLCACIAQWQPRDILITVFTTVFVLYMWSIVSTPAV